MTTDVTTAGSGLLSGLVSITVIRPVLRSLIIAHTFLILLVPLLFALLYYSTPHSRRQPIFILNIISLLLALSLGMIADVAGIYAILLPQEVLPPTVFIASGGISIFQSMLVDLILLMRLVVVYPLSRVGPRRFMLVTSLPILLKLARVINVLMFLTIITNILNNPTSGMNPFTAYFASPYLKVEWAAQIVDNAYASLMFLRTIHGRGVADEYIDNDDIVQSTLACRLRALFRIAFSNFVIPTLFSVVLLIISFHDVNGDYVGDIVYVNSMVSVYGVVFASVWVGVEGRRKLEERKQSLDSENSNINGSTNNIPGAGTLNLTTGPTFSVGVMGAVIDSQSQGLEGAKQGVDLEASHEFALVPVENGRVETHLSSPPARSCGGMNTSSS